MKNIILLVVFCIFNHVLTAQTDGISYQAVIIDNNPQEIPGVDIPSNNLPNTPLAVQFTILDDADGLAYQELHQTETDPFGMINLMIGKGNASVGEFNQIYWDGSKQLQVEIDLFDGNGLVLFSTQELTYVPYVRHREIIASSTLDVDGATNLNNSLNINNQSSTNLTGSLNVDLNTDLNNDLTVHNQSPTHLTGDLTVDGLVSFDGELAVGGDTNLYSDLTVSGNTQLDGNLNVFGLSTFSDSTFENIFVTQNSSLNTLSVDGIAHLNNALNVYGITNIDNSLNILNDNTTSLSGHLTVNDNSNLNGQVTISTSQTGGQSNYNAYPLRVEGSDQGIAIKVNGGRNTNKNFVTFWDANGIHGAIEGQTINELQSSFRFIWDEAMAGLEQAFTLAEQIACGVQLDAAEAGVMLVNNFVLGAKWIELTLNATNNVGVSYETGGADYAEWLEKEFHDELFTKGDVVGVKGGKISKNVNNAHHIMVISTNPIILGNMVKEHAEHYEKVAFLGQVPVRVVGPVSLGDYIMPSGNHDGTGIAVSPEAMKINDYTSILGVAWEASRNATFGYVNVAIGINTNDIAFKVAQQQQEIDTIKDQLKRIESLLNGEQISSASDDSKQSIEVQQNLFSKQISKSMSDADMELWIKNYGYIVEISMSQLKQRFMERNIDISLYPEVAEIINNPISTLRKMHSGDYLPTLWKSLEKRYPNSLKASTN